MAHRSIARSCIRGGAKARYFNVVDLVNKLEAEVKLGRQGRIADRGSRSATCIVCLRRKALQSG